VKDAAMNPIFLSVVVVLALASRAQALPEYPDKLQEAANTPCLPHCNVCHRDDSAGDGTVDRPFVRNMQRLGGLGDNEDSVASAVTQLMRLGTDSDGDGTADITELAMGDDPNDAYEASICSPQAGCALGTGEALDLGLITPLLLALCLRRRRAARR
jgi:hypothetical protein